jgi:hypothetical protein
MADNSRQVVRKEQDKGWGGNAKDGQTDGRTQCVLEIMYRRWPVCLRGRKPPDSDTVCFSFDTEI